MTPDEATAYLAGTTPERRKALTAPAEVEQLAEETAAWVGEVARRLILAIGAGDGKTAKDMAHQLAEHASQLGHAAHRLP